MQLQDTSTLPTITSTMKETVEIPDHRVNIPVGHVNFPFHTIVVWPSSQVELFRVKIQCISKVRSQGSTYFIRVVVAFLCPGCLKPFRAHVRNLMSIRSRSESHHKGHRYRRGKMRLNTRSDINFVDYSQHIHLPYMRTPAYAVVCPILMLTDVAPYV